MLLVTFRLELQFNALSIKVQPIIDPNLRKVHRHMLLMTAISKFSEFDFAQLIFISHLAWITSDYNEFQEIISSNVDTTERVMKV